MKAFKAFENPEKTGAKQTLISLNEHKRHQLDNHFRNVHALVKNNRPISYSCWTNSHTIIAVSRNETEA